MKRFLPILILLASCGGSEKTPMVNWPSKDSIAKITEQDSTDQKPKVIEKLPLDTIFDRIDSLVFQQYKMVVITTYMNNSVLDIIDQINQFVIMPLKQKFSFYKKGILIHSCKLPINRVTVLSSSNKMVNILDNVVMSIGLLKGTKGALYQTYGAGGCNACSESFGLFDLNGNLLCFHYNTRSKVYVSFGNDSIEGVKTGIPLEKIQSLDSLKYIYPPSNPK
ncbi:MAG TPA: hypothetical protein VL651_09545 [Bacteroidia bacterium]|nr:hypothetical protein [Bacteroidia bacterium]